MSELSVVLAFLGGIAVGVFFFGGLWLTIRHINDTRRPGVVLFVSSFVRIVLAMGGLYVAAWGRWERLLIAVIGFILARMVIVRSFGYPEIDSHQPKEATPHGIES